MKIREEIYFLLYLKWKNYIKFINIFAIYIQKNQKHYLDLGAKWSEYLYNNLFGIREIISNILYDFETFEKFGFIFPEVYYEIEIDVKEFDDINFHLHIKNKKFINYILLKLFSKFRAYRK